MENVKYIGGELACQRLVPAIDADNDVHRRLLRVRHLGDDRDRFGDGAPPLKLWEHRQLRRMLAGSDPAVVSRLLADAVGDVYRWSDLRIAIAMTEHLDQQVPAAGTVRRWLLRVRDRYLEAKGNAPVGGVAGGRRLDGVRTEGGLTVRLATTVADVYETGRTFENCIQERPHLYAAAGVQVLSVSSPEGLPVAVGHLVETPDATLLLGMLSGPGNGLVEWSLIEEVRDVVDRGERGYDAIAASVRYAAGVRLIAGLRDDIAAGMPMLNALDIIGDRVAAGQVRLLPELHRRPFDDSSLPGGEQGWPAACLMILWAAGHPGAAMVPFGMLWDGDLPEMIELVDELLDGPAVPFSIAQPRDEVVAAVAQARHQQGAIQRAVVAGLEPFLRVRPVTLLDELAAAS